ncbi:hypothetical protein ACFU0W_05890 [Microbacterium keratanolyticum]|uniref:hypothetical protein n=1 Tax=Microbacterium keratanolyticum TaxID=67574 RepID=UPI0036274D26
MAQTQGVADSSASPPTRSGRARRAASARRPANLTNDLTLLLVVGLLLVAAIGAGGAALYREFYSPAAFVQRYLSLLEEGRAADALQLPGVAISHTDLATTDILGTASDVLLRRAALNTLSDVEIVDQRGEGDEFLVTATYNAGSHAGTTTFRVQQLGWIGVAPSWAFAQSPLSVIELTLRGAEEFSVNGFTLDRRQVAAGGLDAPPLEPLPLLVFSPGMYTVAVDTMISTADPVGVLADAPLVTVPLNVQTEPTEAFTETVTTRVSEFLTACAQQEVLQPTACPFGLQVQNRVTSAPAWSIIEMPVISVVPDGANWKILPASAVAHVDVEVKSLFDGEVTELSEDVPFRVDGTITILPDGSASIRIGAPAE